MYEFENMYNHLLLFDRSFYLWDGLDVPFDNSYMRLLHIVYD